jgi:16S rRNA (uracil1498-N3)-methyltransferase
MKIDDAIARLGGTRIVLSESEHAITLKEALQVESGNDRRAETQARDGPRVVLAFGPEGGWTEGEIEKFRDAGWISASLGSSILRAETAVIAAVAITMAELQ